MTNKTKLLPCPCCEGEAKEMYTYLQSVEWVACLKCGLETKGFGNADAAAQAWNERPAPVEDARAAAEEPVGKYDEVLKPFMLLMERELHANSHKGDRPAWLKMSAGECLLEIYFHAGKLHKAVHAGDGNGMLEYAADVANLSMMLTDIVGALGLFAHDEAANAKR